jgi:hypothetical protein
MEAEELARAVRRAVQFTIAGKIALLLASHVPSLAGRSIIAVGASALLVGARDDSMPSSSVAADLSLTVTTSTLVQGLAASGADSLPLTLAHLCLVLEAGGVLAPLFLGHLADSFIGNVQYLFATATSAALLAAVAPVVALAIAAGVAALSAASSREDSTLSAGLAMASTSVVKAMVLQSIPPGLQLPSIAALVCFFRPLYMSLGLGEPIYTFALYQAGEALQYAIEASLAPFVAAALAATVCLVSPIPAFRAIAQIAAVGSAADWVVGAIQEAADADPFPALLSILMFARVLLAAFPG